MYLVSKHKCRQQLHRTVGFFVALASAGALSVGQASATQIFHPSPNSCVADNCNAVSLGGTVNSVVGGRAGPWTIEVFAGQNQCLRLSTTQTGSVANLELVVAAPNGNVYRNTGAPNPLVKFVALNSGWHTVSISEAASAAIERDFELIYGVYTNAGNPNCANPTPVK